MTISFKNVFLDSKMQWKNYSRIKATIVQEHDFDFRLLLGATDHVSKCKPMKAMNNVCFNKEVLSLTYGL